MGSSPLNFSPPTTLLPFHPQTQTGSFPETLLAPSSEAFAASRASLFSASRSSPLDSAASLLGPSYEHGPLELPQDQPAMPCPVNPARQGMGGGRLAASPLQTQSLRKPCLYLSQGQPGVPHYSVSSMRSLPPSLRDSERFCIPEEPSAASCYHCPSAERFSRPMSPLSRSFHTPSPYNRSSSRGSSQSYQSSSAEDSGRDAASSGIGLSGSSVTSSRRASDCSLGVVNAMAYRANAMAESNSTGSTDGSLDSRLNLNGSELTVKSATIRSDGGNHSLCRYSDEAATKSGDIHRDLSKRTGSIESIESELTCPICLDLFHNPVLLPCAHNLCASCAEQLSSSSQALGQSRDFTCPTCRETVHIDERGISVLRHNLTLQNIVDGYRRAAAASVTSQGIATCSDFELSSGDESNASNGSGNSDGGHNLIHSHYVRLPRRAADSIDGGGQVNCQFCESEPPHLAVKTCLTCRAYYCERCLRLTHPRKKPFVNHKLVAATPGSAGTLSSTSQPARNAVKCNNHPHESASLFCWSCDSCLCKVCGSSPYHAKHSVTTLSERADQDKLELEGKVSEVEKLKSLHENAVDRCLEACHETEVCAESQEASLQAECDMLVRIILGRKEAILSKIKEKKTMRLRQLSQKANEARQRAESCIPALEGAQKALLHSNDFDWMFKHCRTASQRLSEVLSSPNDFLPVDEDLNPPGFCFQFSKEKSVLEGLDIIEAPVAPRICEELCTQSHDKVTVQWRSPDHCRADAYELQYAVDSLHTSYAMTSPEKKDENWMIVPNIKDCHYTVHGLQSGTRYIFVVKATNEAGSSRSECCALKTLGIPFAFDSHSMHKKLRLANHGYTATRDDSNRKFKDAASLCCVTGNVDIECGKHYWEVVVCQSSSFTIGVAYSDVSRYDWIGKNSSSWCLCRLGDEWSARHSGKDIPVDMSLPLPKKIGVLLDYDNASLSFFDGASGRHIHSFCSPPFKRPLRPAFAIGNKSLTINTGITLPDHLRHVGGAC